MRASCLALALAVATSCSASSRGPAKNDTPQDASSPVPGDAGGSDGATPLPPPGSPEGGADAGLSAWEQGVATYYAADGTGNCSFDASPGDLMVAAMDAPEYDNSAVCGECVRLVGPNATITVRIVDQCPECETGHLDLSQQAFAMIADVSKGRVPITWQVVACDVTGPVAYRFKEGSSQYWTAIQVRNSRLPVASLEWMTGGAWSSIPRQSYDYFVLASGVATTGPFQVRVTAAGGEQLVDTLPGVVAATVVEGAAQFP